MNKFRESLPKDSLSDPKKIESAFKVFCKDLKLRENRFVSYFLSHTGHTLKNQDLF